MDNELVAALDNTRHLKLTSNLKLNSSEVHDFHSSFFMLFVKRVIFLRKNRSVGEILRRKGFFL